MPCTTTRVFRSTRMDIIGAARTACAVGGPFEVRPGCASLRLSCPRGRLAPWVACSRCDPAALHFASPVREDGLRRGWPVRGAPRRRFTSPLLSARTACAVGGLFEVRPGGASLRLSCPRGRLAPWVACSRCDPAALHFASPVREDGLRRGWPVRGATRRRVASLRLSCPRGRLAPWVARSRCAPAALHFASPLREDGLRRGWPVRGATRLRFTSPLLSARTACAVGGLFEVRPGGASLRVSCPRGRLAPWVARSRCAPAALHFASPVREDGLRRGWPVRGAPRRRFTSPLLSARTACAVGGRCEMRVASLRASG